MADTQQPASRESVMRLEQRVERLCGEVREDRANLYSKVNGLTSDVAVLSERSVHSAGALVDLKEQCGRIEQKLDEHAKADEGRQEENLKRREADKAASINRLWTWIAIIAAWLFGMIQLFINHKPNGG